MNVLDAAGIRGACAPRLLVETSAGSWWLVRPKDYATVTIGAVCDGPYVWEIDGEQYWGLGVLSWHTLYAGEHIPDWVQAHRPPGDRVLSLPWCAVASTQ